MAKRITRGICALTAAVTALCTAGQSMVLAARVNVMDAPFEGYALNTPEENLFRIEGYSDEFIMLDVGISDSSKFFVMTKGAYGTRQFDPDATQKFDPEDANNIAYFLNNDFMTTTGTSIPMSLRKHVDKNHVWATEAGNKDGNCPEDYETKCGIALMSYAEAELYNGMYGIKDGLDVGWWLRTSRGEGGREGAGLSMRVSNDQYLARAFEYYADGMEIIRPVFWLDRDTFKNIKLDTEKTGSAVAEKLRGVYTGEELQNCEAGYANHEIRALGFEIEGINEVASVEIDNAPSYIMDQSTAGFTVSINITGTQTIDYTIEYNVGDAVYTDTMSVAPGRDVKKRISLSDVPKGAYDFSVNIKNGDKSIKKFSAVIGIVKFYEKQFMDEYNRQVMSTHFLFNDQTNFTEVGIMKNIGVLENRDEIYWANIEREKGVWDWTRPDVPMGWLNDADMDTYLIVDFSNNLYVPKIAGVDDPTKIAPRTQAELDAFCEYVKQVLTRYPRIKGIEVWNETNWGFWQPEQNALDNATMVKRVSMAAKEVRPDIYIMAGSLVYINGTQYFYDFLDQDIYRYVDSISTHPYVHPLNPDPALPNRIKVGRDIFDRYGGFKDHFASEVGLTTSTTASGSSNYTQAVSLVKNHVYNDAYNIYATSWYNFRNKGTNISDNEHNFGIINRDYTAKDAVISLSQRNNVLNGSIYQGQLNVGAGVQAHLYMKDGAPVAVAWKESGQMQLEMPNSRVEDMYGNEKPHSDSVTLTEEPVYIFGISQEWYANAAAYTANKYYDKFIASFDGVWDDIQAITALKADANGISGSTSPQQIKQLMNNVNTVANSIISKRRTRELPITDVQMMSMLNDLFRAQQALASLYAAYGGSCDAAAVNSAYNSFRSKVEEKDSVDYFATMYVSDELLRHAKRYATRANEISAMAAAPGKDQAVSFYLAMAEFITSWGDKVSDFEKVDEYSGVVVYADPSRINVYQGESTKIDVTVENNKRADMKDFEIVVYDNEGSEVSRTDKKTVASGQSGTFTVTVAAPSTKLRGSYLYNIVLEANGEKLTGRGLYVNVNGVVDVSMQPAEKPLSSLRSIKVKVDNIYNKPVALQVTLTPPQGWVLEKETQTVKVNSKSTQTIEFTVKKAEKARFNNYSFNVKAVDQTGNMLVNETVPLDMPFTVQASEGVAPADFTGDMTSWSDAYPVYINAPSDADKKESWTNNDISARMYTKWDSNYFYVIVDVNDETFIQSFSGNAIWNNDSVQISWDTKNDKNTGSYLDDDYELGFALTSAGEQIWAYKNGPAANEAIHEDWIRIIRDNENRITRYYARIPLTSLAPLKAAHGKKYGFNIAINDADLSEREDQIALTPGTGSPINPSLYYTYTFWKKESKLKDGDAEPPLVPVVSENYEKTEPVFSDISGHWAQADIQALAGRGVVQGYDGKFEPEGIVTRAEFLAMTERAMGVSPTEYKGVYDDVAAENWYAGVVQAASERGYIPPEMTAEGFAPEQAITREEMAAVASMVCNITTAAAVDYLDRFSDKDGISDWACSYVARTVKEGVILGNADGTFAPGNSSTRAEAVTVVKRLMDKYSK